MRLVYALRTNILNRVYRDFFQNNSPKSISSYNADVGSFGCPMFAVYINLGTRRKCFCTIVNVTILIGMLRNDISNNAKSPLYFFHRQFRLFNDFLLQFYKKQLT